jgi:hypothetical protein
MRRRTIWLVVGVLVLLACVGVSLYRRLAHSYVPIRVGMTREEVRGAMSDDYYCDFPRPSDDHRPLDTVYYHPHSVDVDWCVVVEYDENGRVRKWGKEDLSKVDHHLRSHYSNRWLLRVRQWFGR